MISVHETKRGQIIVVIFPLEVQYIFKRVVDISMRSMPWESMTYNLINFKIK